jgi:hypothetical protein
MVYDVTVDSKTAAKNVQCIHTSGFPGTILYRCHQDWLMGVCGVTQKAAEVVSWFLCTFGYRCTVNHEVEVSHDICNAMYIEAFEHEFIAQNQHNCSNVLDSRSLPRNFKMGYMETRRK